MNRKKILRFSIILLLVYLLVHVLVYTLQEQFLFLEKSLKPNHTYTFDYPFEEHFLKMENGEKINALFFETPDSVKGNILYFHGNAGNLDRWGKIVQPLVAKGFNVFIIDYRGYGKSDGKPTEANLIEDGQKAYDWLRSRFPKDNLIIYGRSLGSGVACHVATGHAPDLLILETPLSNVRDIVQTRYPFLILPFSFRHQFPNIQNLEKISCPVHIYHGTSDKVIPLTCAEKLKRSMKPNDRFHIIEGAGHNDLIDFPTFTQALDQTLDFKN